jgi:hypothetical protein
MRRRWRRKQHAAGVESRRSAAVRLIADAHVRAIDTALADNGAVEVASAHAASVDTDTAATVTDARADCVTDNDPWHHHAAGHDRAFRTDANLRLVPARHADAAVADRKRSTARR